jgi:hypothetical protein
VFGVGVFGVGVFGVGVFGVGVFGVGVFGASASEASTIHGIYFETLESEPHIYVSLLIFSKSYNYFSYSVLYYILNYITLYFL